MIFFILEYFHFHVIFVDSSKSSSMKVGDLEVGDIDDLDDDLNDVQLQGTAARGPARKPQKSINAKPIDTHTAIVRIFCTLKTLHPILF